MTLLRGDSYVIPEARFIDEYRQSSIDVRRTMSDVVVLISKKICLHNSDGSDKTRDVQAKQIARGVFLRLKKVERLH